MSIGRMPKVVAVVEEDTFAEELPAEETRAVMDRVGEEGGAENLDKDLIQRRRKPPPYMSKLFKDHTR